MSLPCSVILEISDFGFVGLFEDGHLSHIDGIRKMVVRNLGKNGSGNVEEILKMLF